MNAQVGLGDDGKFFIETSSAGGEIDLVVDSQGYFLPTNPGGGLTPTVGRLVDTTRSEQQIASQAERSPDLVLAQFGKQGLQQSLGL